MSKHQLLLLVGALLLFALLYIAPKTPPAKLAEDNDKHSHELPLDQEIETAANQVKSGEAPMKGIFALRDIVKNHPENIKAQQYLADFAVVSGQFDKAIDRCMVILKIDSTFAPAFKTLHEAYKAVNDITNAEKALLKYNELKPD